MAAAEHLTQGPRPSASAPDVHAPVREAAEALARLAPPEPPPPPTPLPPTVALAGAGVALLLLALALLALAVRAGRWALAQGRLLHRRRAWHRARALWQNQLARSPLPQDAPVLAQALADHVRHHHLAPPADWWAELDTWRFAPTTLQSPASAHETLDRLARQLPAPLPPEPPA